jgi:hypothetical protein
VRPCQRFGGSARSAMASSKGCWQALISGANGRSSRRRGSCAFAACRCRRAAVRRRCRCGAAPCSRQCAAQVRGAGRRHRAGATFCHHLRRERLAEFIVGDADHGAIGNAGQADQYMFDLCRVDIHPARNHHVGSAIADIEKAFLIEIAHVADADQTVVFHLAAGGVVAVVAEVGIGRLVGVDASDLACRQILPGVIEDADARLADHLAGAPRFAQRILRCHDGDVARFAGGVGLVDYRSQPVDHRLLDLGGAG